MSISITAAQLRRLGNIEGLLEKDEVIDVLERASAGLPLDAIASSINKSSCRGFGYWKTISHIHMAIIVLKPKEVPIPWLELASKELQIEHLGRDACRYYAGTLHGLLTAGLWLLENGYHESADYHSKVFMVIAKALCKQRLFYNNVGQGIDDPKVYTESMEKALSLYLSLDKKQARPESGKYIGSACEFLSRNVDKLDDLGRQLLNRLSHQVLGLMPLSSALGVAARYLA